MRSEFINLYLPDVYVEVTLTFWWNHKQNCGIIDLFVDHYRVAFILLQSLMVLVV